MDEQPREMIEDRPLPSPCISVCIIEARTSFCKGCWRTIQEVEAWGRLDNAARQAILAQLHERRRAAGMPDRRRAKRRRAAAGPDMVNE
ncbi:MAG: DUF1289 domain-containing protein [Alphaproteobacteria bacterium]|nr:DUF1289 domain-containing protein [Alphaproteobacteria bacterium]